MKSPARHLRVIGSRAEEPLNEFVTADSKMCSHIRKNSGECSHLYSVVIGNRHMMLATFLGGQAQVATCLPRRSIAQAAQHLGKIRSRNVSR